MRLSRSLSLPVDVINNISIFIYDPCSDVLNMIGYDCLGKTANPFSCYPIGQLTDYQQAIVLDGFKTKVHQLEEKHKFACIIGLATLINKKRLSFHSRYLAVSLSRCIPYLLASLHYNEKKHDLYDSLASAHHELLNIHNIDLLWSYSLMYGGKQYNTRLREIRGKRISSPRDMVSNQFREFHAVALRGCRAALDDYFLFDREWVLSFIRQRHLWLRLEWRSFFCYMHWDKHLDQPFLRDPTVLFELLDINSEIFNVLPDDVRGRRWLVLHVVSNNGFHLQKCGFEDDYEVVKGAILNNSYALLYASTRLRSDRTLTEIVLSKGEFSFDFVNHRFAEHFGWGFIIFAYRLHRKIFPSAIEFSYCSYLIEDLLHHGLKFSSDLGQKSARHSLFACFSYLSLALWTSFEVVVYLFLFALFTTLTPVIPIYVKITRQNAFHYLSEFVFHSLTSAMIRLLAIPAASLCASINLLNVFLLPVVFMRDKTVSAVKYCEKHGFFRSFSVKSENLCMEGKSFLQY